MITCQHTHHLLDRYLDGELSPSLQAELHAHQLNCSGCQTELAMLEACGDVIAGDKREPVVSGSFTDRVLLAHRAQMRPRARRWDRTFLLVSSPMAAAASIVFAILLIAPSIKDGPRQPRVDSKQVAAPEVVRRALVAAADHKLSPTEEAVLAITPQMDDGALGLVEDWLEPLVAQTRNTVERARNSAEQLEFLLRLGASDINDMLVANWRSVQRDEAPAEPPANQAAEEVNLLEPGYPGQAPPNEEPSIEPAVTTKYDAL